MISNTTLPMSVEVFDLISAAASLENATGENLEREKVFGTVFVAHSS